MGVGVGVYTNGSESGLEKTVDRSRVPVERLLGSLDQTFEQIAFKFLEMIRSRPCRGEWKMECAQFRGVLSLNDGVVLSILHPVLSACSTSRHSLENA